MTTKPAPRPADTNHETSEVSEFEVVFGAALIQMMTMVLAAVWSQKLRATVLAFAFALGVKRDDNPKEDEILRRVIVATPTLPQQVRLLAVLYALRVRPQRNQPKRESKQGRRPQSKHGKKPRKPSPAPATAPSRPASATARPLRQAQRPVRRVEPRPVDDGDAFRDALRRGFRK